MVHRWIWTLGAFLLALAPPGALACPFCAKLTRSYSDEIREADMVVFGSISDPISDPPQGPSTAFVIQTPIKTDGRTDVTKLRIPRYLGVAKAGPVDRLIFGRIESDQLVPTKLQTASNAFVEYLSGLAELADLGQQARLRYAFDRLEDPDAAVAQDAYAEFAKASYRATLAASGVFKADKLRGLLENKSTPPQRVGLYGLLLGLCGEEQDAELLQSIVEAPPERHLPGLDGMLAGLCLLDQETGIEAIILGLTRDDSSSVRRLSALAALSFWLAEHSPEDSIALLARTIPALRHPEVAAQLMDEMRRGKCWQAWDEVQKLAPSPRERDAVVRFALACPKESARAFIEEVRQRDPRAIHDAEQAIDFETDARKRNGISKSDE